MSATKNNIHIFDRYGKLVTTINTATQGWDGTLNGQPLPATDYWFSIEYGDARTLQYRAHFSLVR